MSAHPHAASDATRSAAAIGAKHHVSDYLAASNMVPTLDFELPAALEASAPAEARGLTRDGVRLLVSHYTNDTIMHTAFTQIGEYLRAGDVLVVNTSGTRSAALDVTRADGTPLALHLSTHLPGDLWSVELRTPSASGTTPFRDGRAGEVLRLPGGASATLRAPYPTSGVTLCDAGWPVSALAVGSDASAQPTSVRLWLATLQVSSPLEDYLAAYGYPIRYGYVRQRWPISAYQTVYATEVGSAEMPSAGRAFSAALLTRLMAQGVQIVPLLLHTGVASLEEHEPPYEEFYRVPQATARVINAARREGSRIVAVGTTVVRALETVADTRGSVHVGEGWTSLLVTPARGIRVVDGLLTGLHEPRATHLAMLEALAGRDHLRLAYAAALRGRYLWHEFGDLHLMLP